MAQWKQLSNDKIKERVFSALRNNIDYFKESTLGLPGSHLDQKVFSSDVPFLKDAPYLSTLIQNPNHIGCHTLGESESFFEGTHELEREVIKICAEEIFRGAKGQQDGYISSGGTEANIQALWIYRNYFQREFQAQSNEISVICSEDSHYSMIKGANLLNISVHRAKIDPETRKIDQQVFQNDLEKLLADGQKYFIVVANMMTTMFGSIDQPEDYTKVLDQKGVVYKLHIDGAYGGFVYPFSEDLKNSLHFENEKVSSIALDAHKMLQAPYGTGIFIARKGLIDYVYTKDASYVKGLDATLVGSRSGANAVAVWMILMSYGFYGWSEKIQTLLSRTKWLCRALDDRGIRYYRNPHANIVTIKADAIDHKLAHRYGLIPDNHYQPTWFKIVVMDHVTIDKMEPFIQDLDHLLVG